MSKQITGILKAPSGAILGGQTIGLVAIRSTPPSIIKGALVSFTTDGSGFYDVTVENGYFRVTAETESGGDIALGSIYIDGGAASDLPTLLSINEEPDAPVNAALQSLADAAAASALAAEQSAIAAQSAADSINPADYVPSTEKGVANGVATLEGDGKVPAIQLPSYVDDVVEYPDFASLPAVGESGKIYITLDNGKSWRWASTAYVEISASMSGSEIKALYEAEPDTNAFTDAEQSKLAGLSADGITPDNSVSTVKVQDGAVTQAKIDPSLDIEYRSGRKNYIINGQFNVSQRGSGPFTAVPYQSIYTADRWWLEGSNSGSSTVDIINSGDQNPVYLQATISPGTTQAIIEQRIEDHQDFNGQDVVASFDLWGPSGGQVLVDLEYFNGTSYTFSAGTLVDFTTTRTRYTVNLTGPAFTAKTANSFIALRFVGQAGPTVTLNLDNVQLEKGTIATDFEYRPFAEELALCKRYYEIGVIGRSGDTVSGFSYQARTPFSVEKRVAPSITLADAGSPSGFSAVPGASQSNNWEVVETRISNTTISGGIFLSTYTADAEL